MPGFPAVAKHYRFTGIQSAGDGHQAFLVAHGNGWSRSSLIWGPDRTPAARRELETWTPSPACHLRLQRQHERLKTRLRHPGKHYGAHRNRPPPLAVVFLCSPFGQRTFYKPLATRGLRMMNMIHRNRPEGGTLYEKLIHFCWSANGRPIVRTDRPFRITSWRGRAGARWADGPGFSISAAAGREVQDFVKETPLAMRRISFCWISMRKPWVLRDQINRPKTSIPAHPIETRRVSCITPAPECHQEHFAAEPATTDYVPDCLIICRNRPAILMNLFTTGCCGRNGHRGHMNDSKPFAISLNSCDWQ